MKVWIETARKALMSTARFMSLRKIRISDGWGSVRIHTDQIGEHCIQLHCLLRKRAMILAEHTIAAGQTAPAATPNERGKDNGQNGKEIDQDGTANW